MGVELRCLDNFKTRLTDKKHRFGIDEEAQIKAEVTTAEKILQWPSEVRRKLETELRQLFQNAFPRMPEKERLEYVADYFTTAGDDFHRQTVFMRNKIGNLVGTGLFDQGIVHYQGRNFVAIYSVTRAVLPEYQSVGLAQTINVRLLTELKPDVLLANVYQSGALHAWIGIWKKGLAEGYEVFPRLENVDGRDVLITLPYSDLDFVINVFKQTYIRLVKRREIVDREIGNLTVHLVRKDTHGVLYDFNPWKREGREDMLAKSLGVTERDGVLVMFRKIGKL